MSNQNPQWLMSTAQYRMPSPDGLVFEPMMPVKTVMTDWIKAQPYITPCADPTRDTPVPTEDPEDPETARLAEIIAAEKAEQARYEAEDAAAEAAKAKAKK